MSTRQLPDDCPPVGHLPAEGTFYRLSRPSAKLGETLVSTDWVLPVDTKKSDCYQNYGVCECYAFSIFAELEHLLEARKFVGWAKKKSIARLDLTPDMGVVLKTPSDVGESHHDWWPTEGHEAPPAVVVEEQRVA